MNTNELENEKPEDRDEKTLSSVFVPGAGTEPASYRLTTSVNCDKEKSERAEPFRLVTLYPEPGSNRHGHYWPLDFKSSASTNSAIRASTTVLLF
jgi:hypothetical protein